MLVIQAQMESFEGSSYTSARLRTAGRFSIAPSATYPTVRIEAAVRVDAAAGLWPAVVSVALQLQMARACWPGTRLASSFRCP